MCIKLHTFSKLLKVAKSLPQKHFNIIVQSTKFRYRDIVEFKTLSPTFLVERWRLSIHCWRNEIFIERRIHFPDECNFRRELLHLSRQYRSHKSASVSPNLNCIALSLHNVRNRPSASYAIASNDAPSNFQNEIFVIIVHHLMQSTVRALPIDFEINQRFNSLICNKFRCRSLFVYHQMPFIVCQEMRK